MSAAKQPPGDDRKIPAPAGTQARDAATSTGAQARGGSLRGLAAVDQVLREPLVAALAETYPREVVVAAVRTVIERLRREIIEGGRQNDAAALTPAQLAPWVEKLVETAVSPSLRRVINATGVVAHTNLGRSVLPPEALAAVATAAGSYTDLELDLVGGERATRQRHVRDVLCTLTGAADALVVNNNAAAILLALAATSRDGEVIVSRGELVEIGEGFRIPDILAESGARLVEVGTTNRTYLRDVEHAWSEHTRAVLRVHTSNYRIVGFTAQPGIEELVGLAHERGALVIDDLGSGALADLPLFAEEPAARESLRLGADLVTFSGDKLLGGPQAGIILGSAEAIGRLRSHPLARALRIDKLNLAALDALLRLYLDPARAVERVPTLALLSQTREALVERAGRLRDAVGEGEVVDSVARAGARALPVAEVASVALALAPRAGAVGELAARLRRGSPAVLGYVHGDRVLLDVLAVRDHEIVELAAAVRGALASA